MDAILSPLTEWLDLGRASVLRRTLAFTGLRSIFVHRGQRLLFFYLLATAIYLPLSLFFPLWILVAGPILYGLPHIFASLRYVHRYVAQPDPAPSRKADRPQSRSFHFLALVWLAVTGIKILTDRGWALPGLNPEMASQAFSWPEAGAMIVTLLGLGVVYRKSLSRMSLAMALVAPVLIGTWFFPFETAGALILIHNWIAFAYWHFAAKTRSDRKTAWIATLMFALVHGLVLAGSFDFLYHFASPTGVLDFAGLDYAELGKVIAPWSNNSDLWFHLVVLYAFGQSIHYFVWLKAIPELQQISETPMSFRASAKALRRDLGIKAAGLAIILTLVSFGVWFLISMPIARDLYFAFAAYHGYMEIAALSLVRIRA